MRLFLCLFGIHVTIALAPFAQEDVITFDPITGLKTITHTATMTCTELDNEATLFTYGSDSDPGSKRIVEVTCDPPNYVYLNGLPVLKIPREALLFVIKVCVGLPNTINTTLTTMPIAPGGIVPGTRRRLLWYDANGEAIDPPSDTVFSGKRFMWVNQDTGSIAHSSATSNHEAAAELMRILGSEVDENQQPKFGEYIDNPYRELGRRRRRRDYPLSTRHHFVPLFDPFNKGGLVGKIVNPSCWFSSCDNGPDYSQQISDLATSLDTFANTTSQFISNQALINNNIALDEVTTTTALTNIQFQFTGIGTQLQGLNNETTMLKQSVTILSTVVDEDFATVNAELDTLQTEENELAAIVQHLSNVTQQQTAISNQRDITFGNRLLNILGIIMDLNSKKPVKLVMQQSFFDQLDSLDFTIFQPFLSTSIFQRPDPSVANAMVIIDIFSYKYTLQVDSGSPFFAVDNSITWSCNASFLLFRSQITADYINIQTFVGPEDCLLNGTCQCIMQVSTTMAQIADPGTPLNGACTNTLRPYPTGFPYSRTLQCPVLKRGNDDPSILGTPTCTGPILSYTDPFNQNPTSQQALTTSIGTYSVANVPGENALSTAQVLAKSRQRSTALCEKPVCRW